MIPDLRFANLINRPPPAEMIAAMAAELTRCDAFGSVADAIRALTGKFGYGEIIAFADAAISEAQRRCAGAAP